MRNPFFSQYRDQPLVLSGSDESQQRPFQRKETFQPNDDIIRGPEPEPSSPPDPQVSLGYDLSASQRPFTPFSDPALDIPETGSALRQPSHERSPSSKMPLSPDEELAKIFYFAGPPLDTPHGWDWMPLSNMDDRPNTNSLPRHPVGHQSQRTGDLFLISGGLIQNFGHEDVTVDLNNQGLDLSDRLPNSLAGTVETSEVVRASPHPIPLASAIRTSQVDRGSPLPIPLAGMIGTSHCGRGGPLSIHMADGTMAINLIPQRNPPPFSPQSGYRPHHLNQLSFASMVPGQPNVIAEGNRFFGLYSERQRR